MSKNKTILYIFRSSAGIFFSRILGLLRDTVVTHFFIPSQQDIFNAAFRIPNTFRSIFAEGAMTNSFIPVFKGIENDSEKKQFLSEFFSLFLIIISIVTLLLVVLTPLFMPFLVKGFQGVSQEKLSKTIVLTRYMFSYLFLISLITFFSVVLNSMYKFFVPSLSQGLFNLIFIAVVFLFVIMKKISIDLFIYAVISGGIGQLVFIVFYAMKNNIYITFKIRLNNPHITKVLKLLGPSMLTSATYQINIFISTYFLSLYDGGNTYYYLAQRLFLLPVGLFSVAMNQVFLPTFSDSVQENDTAKIQDSFRYNTKISFFITTTVAFLFIALALPITKLLFYHGKFTYEDVKITAKILTFYMPGMIFLSFSNSIASLFYSYKIWKSQLFVSLLAIVLYGFFIYVLTPYFALYTVSVANTLNTIFQSLMLYFVLVKYKKITLSLTFLSFLGKLFIITIPFAFMLYKVSFYLFGKAQTSFNLSFFKELVIIIGGSAIYFVIIISLLHILGEKMFSEMVQKILSKIKKKSNA